MNALDSTKDFLQQNIRSNNECDCNAEQECKFRRHDIMLL